MCGHVLIFKNFPLNLTRKSLVFDVIVYYRNHRRCTSYLIYSSNYLRDECSALFIAQFHLYSTNNVRTTCEIESRRFLIKKSPFELLSICWTIFLFRFVETGRDRKSGIVASQRANFYCNPIPIRVLVEPLRRKQSDRNRERRKILRPTNNKRLNQDWDLWPAKDTFAEKKNQHTTHGRRDKTKC